MRLIDESAVIENIEEWIDSVGGVVIGKGLSGYAELMGCIEEAPTVEAEPVRHGHWVEPIKEKYAYVLSGTCSVCGWESRLYENDVVGMNYCPNCGAKMDEMERK